MAYKDKDKQREANKEQMRRARAKGNTEQGNTEHPRVTDVLPKCAMPNGDTDISAVKALHQLISKRNDSIKQGSTKLNTLQEYAMDIVADKPKRGKDIKEVVEPEVMVEIDNDGNITPVRTAKPGQMPSPGLQAHCKKVFAANFPKRGKDIKCFADLPADVQQTIDMMSDTNEEKQKRTAAAIKYQHIFPDRYEASGQGTMRTGIVTGKPGDADYNGVCTEAWRAERGR